MYGMVARSMGLWVVPVTALAAPGDHIRVGALEIIPSVGAGAEYRTNVYRRETNGVAASNVLVSPALTAKAAGEDHAFQAGVDWELRKFFFVGDADRGAAGNFDGRVQNLDRFNEFSANVGLDNFKRNAVGLRLNNRTALQNWTIDRPVSDLPYSSQFRNAASLGVRVNPGPALEFVPGARWTFDDFQSFRPADGVERFSNIRNSYGPTLDAGWAFLPRTSLVLRGSYLVHNWQRNELESDDQLDGGVLLPDSRHLKVWTGLDGRLTEKLFLQLLAGYGSAAYSIDGLTGVAGQEAQVGAGVTGPRRLLFKTQVRYDLTPSTERRTGTKFSVGYLRDFRDSRVY